MSVRAPKRRSLSAGATAAALAVLALVAWTPAGEGHRASTLPPEVENLLGSWTGEGTLMGRTATFEMHWERVLGDRFVRLSFSNAFVDGESRQRVLEATAYYRDEGDGRLSGTWFDSRGMVLPLDAQIRDGALVTSWGAAETEQGRTLYRATEDGHVEVIDTVRTSDGEREFGRARYERSR